MIIARIAVHAVIRTAVLALALVAYDWVYDLVVPPPPDAAIGKGLLAFLMLAGIGLLWGLLDGLLTTPAVWAVAWVASSVALGVGWEAWLADGSAARMESGAVVFIAMLVLVPAIVGACLTWALAGRTRTAVLQPR